MLLTCWVDVKYPSAPLRVRFVQIVRMIDFTNIIEHEIERPDVWTSLGSSEVFDSLSDEFKDQIKFLDKEASDFLYRYFKVSKFHTGPMWEPFAKKNFKYVESLPLAAEDDMLGKWLYNKGIPFSKWVFVLPNYGGQPLMMTWKMVIKSCGALFWGDDVVIFDESNQWCLTYWHEDEMFFGRINTTDPEIGYEEVERMNELERKYPGYKHLLK